MKSFIVILLMCSIVCLVGCVSFPQPTSEQLTSANYGKFPVDYEKQIKARAKNYLFDPYSARYTFGKPYKAWSSRTGEIRYGYAIDFTLNAKNRMGGYIGAKKYWAFFYNGNLIFIGEIDSLGRQSVVF